MLLESAHERSGHRCAVLVDEYDKPLLECVDDLGLEERNRAALKAFFGVLKDADEHLRFLLISGVTKFSKVSIFSDLNQLKDITLSAAYAGVCGITEDELLANFGPELDAMADEMATDRDGCLLVLRGKYDGYRFHWKGPGVYNPSTGEYELAVPNAEVEWGLLTSLLPAWAPGYGAARGIGRKGPSPNRPMRGPNAC